MSVESQLNHPKVLWLQVCGLAVVQGAIVLLWVIYNLYLVDLLSRLGFPATLATALLVVENLLAMVMEPLMGSLSDRFQHQVGTRFPVISLGVILAAGAFVCVPAIALGGLTGTLRWLLPLMMVAWALAMTVFRSPALSLLGRYAIGTRLPQAASILTLVGGVAGAMGPLAGDIILGWGPLVTFALGSGILLLAAAMLRTVGSRTPAVVTASSSATPVSPRSAMPWSQLALVFGTGAGVTLGFRLLMGLFNGVLNRQVSGGGSGLVIASIFISLACTAIPAGTLAGYLGNRRAMTLGLAGMAFVSVVVIGVNQSVIAIALAILFGALFSLVSNGTLPFAISTVPAAKAGLGTGMFFSGGAAAASVFGAFSGIIKTLPLALSASLTVLSLLLAGVCILCTSRQAASVTS